MDLYPAIDLRGGRCVRLHQGDYARETVYGADPVAVATDFVGAGARWIHVVDLDAARTGEPVNRSVVGAVAEAVAGRARVQSGGGVRSEAAAAALAEAGVARVVLGTAALEDPELVRRIAGRQPVAVGLDGRGGRLAVRGWLDDAGATVLDVLPRFADAGVAALVVTEIGRDGTLTGPDLDGLAAVLARTDVAVVASGGVGSLDDLRALAALEAGGRRLAGAIVGKAIYEGRVGVADALAAVEAAG
ncbi:MAG: 1-(5-phosphoribosyl)-5-((5-phosphoribosylamino)methylideneamino)imidazole-4-carboxamide isomerase [Acidimicrobiales bacterium]|nr:1-(5-phosphoribosyl)-5-((5-phosphoribosylamino)methylideneamino)imidazole-4-carboxamide isomerase [Acidimicrobiales bacterium]